MRGCGNRKKGGLYLVVPVSEDGTPIEEFLIDQPIPYLGEPFRAPQLVYNETLGAYDVLMWVGKRFYPYVPDFIEEVRMLGISKRIPRTFPINKLTPNKSRLFIIHPRAIPLFRNVIAQESKKICHRDIEEHSKGEKFCIMDLWNISTHGKSSQKHRIGKSELGYEIITPSVRYISPTVDCSPIGNQKYGAGIVAGFYISHFEYVGGAPEELQKKANDGGWKIKEVEG